MKQSITGYITALINVHADIMEAFNDAKSDTISPRLHRRFIGELNALLDFVEDIPEENTSVINFIVSNGETKELENTIKVLEEHKEQMYKYQSQLKESIEALTKENERLKQDLGGEIFG